MQEDVKTLLDIKDNNIKIISIGEELNNGINYKVIEIKSMDVHLVINSLVLFM